MPLKLFHNISNLVEENAQYEVSNWKQNCFMIELRTLFNVGGAEKSLSVFCFGAGKETCLMRILQDETSVTVDECLPCKFTVKLLLRAPRSRITPKVTLKAVIRNNPANNENKLTYKTSIRLTEFALICSVEWYLWLELRLCF